MNTKAILKLQTTALDYVKSCDLFLLKLFDQNIWPFKLELLYMSLTNSMEQSPSWEAKSTLS
jgi:hypothetical protein